MNCAYYYTSTFVEKYQLGNICYDFIYKTEPNSSRDNYNIFFEELDDKNISDSQTDQSNNFEQKNFIAGIIFSERFSFLSRNLKEQIISDFKNNIYAKIGQLEEAFININSLLFQNYYSLDNNVGGKKQHLNYDEIDLKDIEKKKTMINLLICIKGKFYLSNPLQSRQNKWIIKLKNSNDYKDVTFEDLIKISNECYILKFNYNEIQEIILSDTSNKRSQLIKERQESKNLQMQWYTKKKTSNLYYLKIKNLEHLQ